MSSTNPKVSFKMKTQNSETRTLKPILPKPNTGVMTRVIEINAPAMPMCKCFVCDDRVISSGVPLLQSTTQASNTDLPTKIGQLVGDRFMVVVSSDDVLCRKCHALVNHVDKLESDLFLVKRSLVNNLKKKYGLTEVQIKETEPRPRPRPKPRPKSKPKDVEPEVIVVPDGDSDEEVPPPKKPKPTREVKYRAIKPKPTNSVELFKCTTCNFITMQSELLACHRLVCGTLAYKCTMCDKKFDSQKMVLNHKIEAHLTKWICHFCNLNFNDEKKFTLHMKNHLGDRLVDKPIKKADDAKEKTLVLFQCPHCPESFEAFSQLQIHLVNHTSSVSFKCVRCDVGFENKTALMEHVKTHEVPAPSEYILPSSPKQIQIINDTIFSCPVCSLNFIQEDMYLQHLTVHPEFASPNETERAINLLVQQVQENGFKPPEETDCFCGLDTCFKCGLQPKIDENIPIVTDVNDLLVATVGTIDNVGTIENVGTIGTIGTIANVGTIGNVGTIDTVGTIDSVANVGIIDNIGSTEVGNLGNGKEAFLPENAGEEGSHLELNHLLFVNSIDLQFSQGNVPLQNSSEDKNGDASQTEIETNSKSVEDILENMFQVKDEEIMKKGPGDNGMEELAQEINNLNDSQSKTFVCADCSFTTQNLTTLQEHFAEKHELINCNICDKSVDSEELDNHLVTVHGTIPPSAQTKNYTCIHCSEKFINRRALHIHEVTHPENLRIECPDCGEKFAREKFLNEHRDETHVISHCRMCNKAFANVKQLKSHETRHARGEKNQFKCNDCDRVFQTPTGLRHHKAIHTGEFKYKCEFCDKGFVSRVRCEEHRASHTKEERYSCEICGKKFTFQATYWIHRKWHDNPTPYKCNFCGRLFKHSSLLSVHKRKHTGERPYECPHCDQSFAVGNTLKRHLMLHTGVFPFTCHLCDQGFSGKHKLAQHMSRVHQDNTFLGQQSQKKAADYKMVLKPEDEDKQLTDNDPFPNQTWIVTEDESEGSQLMPLQAGDGDSMSCTLLSDDMMGDMADENNRIEIIPYAMKPEDKLEDSSFIELQDSAASLGLVGDDSQDFTPIQEKSDNPEDGVFGSASGLGLDPYENGRDGGDETNGSLSEHFVSQL